MKSNKTRLKLGRLLLIIAAGLVLLLVTAGPPVILNLLLTRILPSEFGVNISYDQAKAGFLFRSISIDKLVVESRSTGKTELLADHIGLKQLSIVNILRLIKNGRLEAKSAWPLVGEVMVKNLTYQRRGGSLGTEMLEVRQLAYSPSSSDLGPFTFEKLETRQLHYTLANSLENFSLDLPRLEARSLTPSHLASLRISGLKVTVGTDSPDSLKLDLGGLTVGGLRTTGLVRALHGRDGILSAIWLLSACDSLDLAATILTRGEREALNIKQAFFDVTGSIQGAPLVYQRRLNFTTDITALVRRPGDPEWQEFRRIFGDSFEVEADLALEYDQAQGQANLQNFLIASSQLGRLEGSARLVGLDSERVSSAQAPSEILLLLVGSRLEHLTLGFEDNGLMLNVYRHLSRTAFKHLPKRPSAANIMDQYLLPIARDLEQEGGLANVPALLSEAQAFLDNPISLKIMAEPPVAPVIMHLANMDKYGIIEKLHLTLQVNDRAPVLVAAAVGAFNEKLLSAPRPLENLFEDDNFDNGQ